MTKHLGYFFLYIYIYIYIIFSHNQWTSHNLPKPYWSSTKDHLSSTKLTGKTPSLKCSQSPAIIKDIDEYQPCRHIDAFAVISLNPLWLTQARGHFRQVAWLRTAHSAEMCAQKKKNCSVLKKIRGNIAQQSNSCHESLRLGMSICTTEFQSAILQGN